MSSLNCKRHIISNFWMRLIRLRNCKSCSIASLNLASSIIPGINCNRTIILIILAPLLQVRYRNLPTIDQIPHNTDVDSSKANPLSSPFLNQNNAENSSELPAPSKSEFLPNESHADESQTTVPSNSEPQELVDDATPSIGDAINRGHSQTNLDQPTQQGSVCNSTNCTSFPVWSGQSQSLQISRRQPMIFPRQESDTPGPSTTLEPTFHGRASGNFSCRSRGLCTWITDLLGFHGRPLHESGASYSVASYTSPTIVPGYARDHPAPSPYSTAQSFGGTASPRMRTVSATTPGVTARRGTQGRSHPDRFARQKKAKVYTQHAMDFYQKDDLNAAWQYVQYALILDEHSPQAHYVSELIRRQSPLVSGRHSQVGKQSAIRRVSISQPR